MIRSSVDDRDRLADGIRDIDGRLAWIGHHGPGKLADGNLRHRLGPSRVDDPDHAPHGIGGIDVGTVGADRNPAHRRASEISHVNHPIRFGIDGKQGTATKAADVYPGSIRTDSYPLRKRTHLDRRHHLIGTDGNHRHRVAAEVGDVGARTIRTHCDLHRHVTDRNLGAARNR